jgi:hypothetical protein
MRRRISEHEIDAATSADVFVATCGSAVCCRRLRGHDRDDLLAGRPSKAVTRGTLAGHQARTPESGFAERNARFRRRWPEQCARGRDQQVWTLGIVLLRRTVLVAHSGASAETSRDRPRAASSRRRDRTRSGLESVFYGGPMRMELDAMTKHGMRKQIYSGEKLTITGNESICRPGKERDGNRTGGDCRRGPTLKSPVKQAAFLHARNLPGAVCRSARRSVRVALSVSVTASWQGQESTARACSPDRRAAARAPPAPAGEVGPSRTPTPSFAAWPIRRGLERAGRLDAGRLHGRSRSYARGRTTPVRRRDSERFAVRDPGVHAGGGGGGGGKARV